MKIDRGIRTILHSKAGTRRRWRAVALASVTASAANKSTTLVAKLMAFGVVADFFETVCWHTVLGVGNHNGKVAGREGSWRVSGRVLSTHA